MPHTPLLRELNGIINKRSLEQLTKLHDSFLSLFRKVDQILQDQVNSLKQKQSVDFVYVLEELIRFDQEFRNIGSHAPPISFQPSGAHKFDFPQLLSANDESFSKAEVNSDQVVRPQEPKPPQQPKKEKKQQEGSFFSKFKNLIKKR